MYAIEIRPEMSAEDNHTGESYCAECRKWYSNSSWIHKNGDSFADSWTTFKVYNSPTDPSSGYTEVILRDQDDIFTHSTIYECPSCYVYLADLNDDEGDGDGDGGYTHLCGACGEGWYNQVDAQDCCSDEEDVKPDPAVFARARREN